MLNYVEWILSGVFGYLVMTFCFPNIAHALILLAVFIAFGLVNKFNR